MGIDKLIIKFICRDKRPTIVNTILNVKNKVGGLMLSDFKTHYKATVTKAGWYWPNNRQTDQWDIIKSPQIDPHKYSQLIFDRGAKTLEWNKGHLFNRWWWNKRYPQAKNKIKQSLRKRP